MAVVKEPHRVEVRHGHLWLHGPTADTNPPTETRTCTLCGLMEMRSGVTVVPNGPSIPATPWLELRASE